MRNRRMPYTIDVTIQTAGLFSAFWNLKLNFVSSRTTAYAPGTKFIFRTQPTKKILARLNSFYFIGYWLFAAKDLFVREIATYR